MNHSGEMRVRAVRSRADFESRRVTCMQRPRVLGKSDERSADCVSVVSRFRGRPCTLGYRLWENYRCLTLVRLR